MADDGRGEPQSVGALVSAFMAGPLSRGLSANQKAAAAWYRANGDIERAHTTGVYLRKSKVQGAPPVLCVYVDSHSRMMDFYVNREVYLLRLADQGFEVSGIEFKLSRKDRTAASAGRGEAARRTEPAKAPLPELTREEKRQADDLAASVPDDLRQSVTKAVELSFRREKSRTTGASKTDEK